MSYTATFTPSGTLKIRPEAYSSGDALPLSDFVLVDGKLQCKRGEETYVLQDDAAVLAFFATTGDMCPCQQVKAFLSNEDFFGPELCKVPGLIESVIESLKAIIEKGMRAVMEEKFGC